MSSTLTIHTDGGSRGNPGPAAAGIVIYDGDQTIHQFARFLGELTNNQAEYQGVILALQYLIDHPNLLTQYQGVSFILDSELIVRQLTGVYRVKHPSMIPLFAQVRSLIDQLNLPVSFSHVKRHLNHQADLLLNQELDSHR